MLRVYRYVYMYIRVCVYVPVSVYVCVCVHCMYMMKLYYDTQNDFQFGSDLTPRKPTS
jgi:hypothetical protein